MKNFVFIEDSRNKEHIKAKVYWFKRGWDIGDYLKIPCIVEIDFWKNEGIVSGGITQYPHKFSPHMSNLLVELWQTVDKYAKQAIEELSQ